MATLVSTLNNCLANQIDGLVNFNDIARLLNPGTRVSRLLQKGNLNDIKANLINLNEGDEQCVFRKQGSTYLVDPSFAVAFVKIQRADLSEAVTQWETVYGRGDIPDQISKNAPELLRHLTSVFINDRFRCTFQDGKWHFCLNDIVRAATEDPHITRQLERVYEFDETLQAACGRMYKFSGGSGYVQALTVYRIRAIFSTDFVRLFDQSKFVAIFRSGELRIVTIDVAARVWMLLPGRKASIFRNNLADLFIRVLGGDPRLAEQIKEIGEFQDQLPANHPLRAFRDQVNIDQNPAGSSTTGIEAALGNMFQRFEGHITSQFESIMSREKSARSHLKKKMSKKIERALEKQRQEAEEARAKADELRAQAEEESKRQLERLEERVEQLAAHPPPAKKAKVIVTNDNHGIEAFCEQVRAGSVELPDNCIVVDGEHPESRCFEEGRIYRLTIAGLYSCYTNVQPRPVVHTVFGRIIRQHLEIENSSANRHGGTPIYLSL